MGMAIVAIVFVIGGTIYLISQKKPKKMAKKFKIVKPEDYSTTDKPADKKEEFSEGKQ